MFFLFKVVIGSSRKDMVFIGGAILSEIMKDKPEFWMMKADYEEQGFRVLEKLHK